MIIKKLEQAQNIGIYGFGIVGQSALRFFSWCRITYGFSYNLLVFDDKKKSLGALSQEHFFETCDLILISPGIDPKPYKKYSSQFITELELFACFFRKSTIAITGTVGKTTVTSLVGSCFKTYALGGNIGIGMLDLIPSQERYDGAILELSSYQLEQNKLFSPDYALLLNAYPNHLDRHENFKFYLHAKIMIFSRQRANQWAFISRDVACDSIFLSYKNPIQSRVCIVSDRVLTLAEQHLLKHKKYDLVFCDKDSVYYQEYNQRAQVIIARDRLPEYTFLENWLFICALLYSKERNCARIAQLTVDKSWRAHRVEYITTINGVSFYNDSKATVMQATNAAITKLAKNNRPIVLILGGRTKGVDPKPWVTRWCAHPAIKICFAFGEQWFDVPGVQWCQTLEQVMVSVMSATHPGDQVLFSPSGESFDLYKNYKERGTIFKNMVHRYAEQ